MPLYQYFCDNCEGVFEALRPIREASEPAPCPVCDGDASRIMPTSVTAFVVRDGIPRRIPDTGGHWHLGKAVKRPIEGPGEHVAYEHPEVHKERPVTSVSRGAKEDEKEKQRLEMRHLRMLAESKVPVAHGPKGPIMSAEQASSGHPEQQVRK